MPMLPALLAFCFTLVVFVAAVLGISKPTAEDFQRRAAAALQAGDFDKAVILLRRQLIADPAAMEPRLRLLEAFVQLQRPQAAIEILNHIAPGNRVVYGPAHLYRASLITAGGMGDPGVRAQARICIELALKADPVRGQGVVDQDAAHGLLAAVLSAGGEWQDALAAIDRIAKPSPANLVLKAMALKNLQRVPEATALADEAMKEAVAVDPGDAPEERIRRASVMAQAFLVKGEFEQAVESALAAGSEPPLKVLQASIVRQVAQSLREAGGSDSARWLENLLRGLLAFPDDMGLTTELIGGAELWNSQPGFGERTARRLRECRLAAHLRLLDGIAAIQKNLPDEGLGHFKAAWESLPGNPVIANNYAAMLGMRRADVDRAAALVIIDGVLKSHPDVPSFLDTKGQILLVLRRPEEAVPFLELALKGAPSPGAHLALAEAYSRLDKKDLADRHRALATGK
jgi:tetratricopeptide (TPR) repeat protein